MYEFLSFTKIIILVTIGLALYIILRVILDWNKQRKQKEDETDS